MGYRLKLRRSFFNGASEDGVVPIQGFEPRIPFPQHNDGNGPRSNGGQRECTAIFRIARTNHNPLLDLNCRIDMVDVKPCFPAYLKVPRKIKLELAMVIRLVLTGALNRDLFARNKRIIARSVNSSLDAFAG